VLPDDYEYNFANDYSIAGEGVGVKALSYKPEGRGLESRRGD
jgi:hypothetical protein